MTTIRNAFTVDLEDWYHGMTSTNRRPDEWPKLESRVVENTECLLALLAEFNVKATFFVLGKVAEQYPSLVQRIDEEQHEIGIHGYGHRMTQHMTRAEFANDLDRSLVLVRDLVQGPVIGYRAPYFSIDERTLWALQVLHERGLRYDSSFFPTRNMLYGYPGAPRFPHRLNGEQGLIEFPLSTVRLLRVTWPIAGGIYLRIIPYHILRGAIRHLNRQNQPAIIYTHPYELDTNYPMRAANIRERVVHYHARHKLEAKLRRIFQDFQFSPLCDLLDFVSTEKRIGTRD